MARAPAACRQGRRRPARVARRRARARGGRRRLQFRDGCGRRGQGGGGGAQADARLQLLLGSESARKLYHGYADNEPILDFHNHLPPDEIAQDRRFANLAEIWLEGDHYKWRAMRANGADESLVTGNGDPKEKFLDWAATLPHALGNPLYHWTHLELKHCFDIDDLLSPENAERIWDQANERLTEPEFSACGLLEKFKVRALCTTDYQSDCRIVESQFLLNN